MRLNLFLLLLLKLIESFAAADSVAPAHDV